MNHPRYTENRFWGNFSKKMQFFEILTEQNRIFYVLLSSTNLRVMFHQTERKVEFSETPIIISEGTDGIYPETDIPATETPRHA